MAYDTPSFSTFSKNIQMFVGSGLGNGLHKSLGLYSDCSFLYLVDYIVSYSYCKLTIIFSIPNSTCQSSILFLVNPLAELI